MTCKPSQAGLSSLGDLAIFGSVVGIAVWWSGLIERSEDPDLFEGRYFVNDNALVVECDAPGSQPGASLLKRNLIL
jgi:hypothetical protein